MSQTSKTLRRLCLATGAVTVAGVLPALALTPAFASASTSVGNPTLSVNPTNAAPSGGVQLSTTVNTFVATNGVSASTGTITITAVPSNGIYLSQVVADYTVKDGSNTITTTAVPNGNTVVITDGGTAIAPGDTVTVTVAHTSNPVGAGSTVHLNDSTTGDGTAIGTPQVVFNAPSSTTSVSNSQLAVNPSTASSATTTQSSTTTDSFKATDGIPASGTLTLVANPSTGQQVLPALVTDYSVKDNGVVIAGTAATPNGNSVSITLPNNASVTPGDTVTATITGTTNPTGAGSTVYYANSTSADNVPQNTPAVTFSAAYVAGTPTVSQVNPNTLPSGAGTYPFTLTGTNLESSTGAAPTVTFTPVPGTTTGAVPVTAVPSASETNNPSTTGYTGTVSGLVAATTYDVLVNNGTATASSPSSSDQVQAVANLTYVPEAGVRAIDSRTGQNISQNAIASGSTEVVSLAAIEAAANIPANATAITMNVTAIGESGVGNLQVFNNATGTAPGTSTVNFTPGVDTGNFTVLPITLNGAAPASNNVYIHDAKNGSAVNVTFDVTGYFAGGSFTPATNGGTRVLDTRPATNTGGLLGPLPGRQEFSLTMPRGFAGKTVALNVTAVAPSAVGNLRVFPDAPNAGGTTPVPNTAVLNYVPGVDSGSYLITQVGQDGKIDLYSDSSGTVNVVVDLTGSLTAGNGGAGSLDSITPYRAYDSRMSGAIGSEATTSVSINGTGTPTDFTPGNAVAAIVSISAINPVDPGNLRAYPDGGILPNAATINYYPKNTRENLAVVALKNGKLDLTNDSAALVNSTVDIVGYVLGS